MCIYNIYIYIYTAFHEAVGDTIALSVMTPDHLRKINLLTDFTDNNGE